MAKNKEPEVLEFANRQIEAEEYLKSHKINELFANITSHLVFNKPGNLLEEILDVYILYDYKQILFFL